MKKQYSNKIISVIFGLLFTTSSQASVFEVRDENYYNQIQTWLKSEAPTKMRLSKPNISEGKLLTDAIEDFETENADLKLASSPRVLELINGVNAKQFELADQVRLAALLAKKGTLDPERAQNLNENLAQFLRTQSDERLAIELLKNENALKSSIEADIFQSVAETHPEFARLFSKGKAVEFQQLSRQDIQDLFMQRPLINHYRNGRYNNSPRLFMFCRHERQYPCLMAMRDASDNTVYDGKGMWTHPALGYVASGAPYYVRSGYTPSGIHEINGVMPVADQNISFGKFRRMILNFVASSTNEENNKLLIPTSHFDKIWWQEAVVARKAGRNLLRIHGTGRQISSSHAPYQPFVATHGCISQREIKFQGVDYKDQRLLLDALMEASGLQPMYENEANIRGLLYVVEIDNKKGPVTKADLDALGLR